MGGFWLWRANVVAWRFTRVTLLVTAFKKSISRHFIKILKVRPKRAFHYPSDFALFLVLLKNVIFWNWPIRIGELDSTFPCWQFSRSSFFAQKSIMKKLIFLCFHDTEGNSTQKEINFQFLSQKEYPFDPCQYRGFLFLHFFSDFLNFVFSGYHM